MPGPLPPRIKTTIFNIGDIVYSPKLRMYGEVVSVNTDDPSYVSVLYQDAQVWANQDVHGLQRGVMRIVNWDAVQPGDLVWFNNNEYIVLENDTDTHQMTIVSEDGDVPARFSKSWEEWENYGLRVRSWEPSHGQVKFAIDEGEEQPGDDTDIEVPPEHQDTIEFIRYWGRKHFILQLRYMDRKGNETFRRVEPYKIEYPYLWAYGLEQGTGYNSRHPKGLGIRSFRLDRILSINRAPRGGRFWPRWEIEL